MQNEQVIVVGGGTAGCLLATRLSEDAAHRVCLIEAGGDGRSLRVQSPGCKPARARAGQ